MAGEIAKTTLAFEHEANGKARHSHCQADIDEQVTTASSDERRGCRREDDRDLVNISNTQE